MAFLARLLFPIIAISSSGFTVLLCSFYIISGKYYKVIQISNEKLGKNLTNQGVAEYISTLNRMKKIPNRHGNWNALREAYTLIERSNNIDTSLKAELRVLLRLKGVNKL